MKPGLNVDTKAFTALLNNMKLTTNNMLNVEGSGAKVLINKQRVLVPKDTTDTENSIGSHIEKATPTNVIDEVGAETDYAPVIEYGRSDMPNYPMQPFIRPSAQSPADVLKAIGTTFGSLVISRWPT